MNLTRIRDLDDVVKLHYCESLFLATLLPLGHLSIADVGSGPGFPGIPIAILRPDCQVALIESNKRKSVFLNEACSTLSNVRVLPVRAQDVRKSFDWTVSRAVSPKEVISLGLSPNIALLIGDKDANRLNDWKPNPIPWGKGRIAATFHVEHFEPRGKI